MDENNDAENKPIALPTDARATADADHDDDRGEDHDELFDDVGPNDIIDDYSNDDLRHLNAFEDVQLKVDQCAADAAGSDLHTRINWCNSHSQWTTSSGSTFCYANTSIASEAIRG